MMSNYETATEADRKAQAERDADLHFIATRAREHGFVLIRTEDWQKLMTMVQLAQGGRL